MTVWRAECNFDSVAIALDAAALGVNLNTSGAGYGITVADGLFQLYLAHAIVHDAELNSPFVPQYHSRAVAGVLATSPGPSPNLFPLARSFYQGDNVIDALDNGVAFVAGGLFAIEKDTSTGDLRFITPMGTWNTTCGAEGLPTTTEIRPLSVGILLRVQHFFYPPDSTPAQSIDIHFQDFYGRENGSIISGAAVSAVDPGDWQPWMESDDFDRHVAFTPTQQTSDYEAQLLSPGNSDPNFPQSTEDAWYRPFNGADRMASPLPMDTCVVREHAAILGVWLMMPGHISFRHSHDGGATWIDRMISGPTVADSPTVQWFAGTAYVCYYEAGAILTVKSVDFGLTWSTTMAISITGTNPRLVIAPDGTFFYFYIAGGILWLQRSADLGNTLMDAIGIVVVATITAQEFGAVMGEDRALMVSYIDTGNWISRRSIDWGLNWVTV